MFTYASRIRMVLSFVLFFGVLLGSSMAFSKELIVCTNPVESNEYRYWEDALSAASNGDTIIVRRSGSDPNPMNLPTTNASFQGNLNFDGKALKLLNADDDPETVIIRGYNSSNSTVYFDTNQASGCVIKGFTIIGDRGTGSGNGGAMSIHRTLTVENCIIRDSSAQNGGGVRITNEAKPIFRQCVFINNSASNGGAVYVDDTGSGAGFPSFSDCWFIGNNRSSGDGEVAYLDQSPASFINCTMSGNASDDIVIYQNDSFLPLTMMNCIVDASGDEAIRTRYTPLEGQSQFYILNSYVNGDYTCRSGLFQTADDLEHISMVYEPNGIQADHDTFVSYTGYLPTSSFNLNFVNTGSYDYHLRMDSSAIGLGLSQNSNDIDDEFRPYYLGVGTDLGADQFNFCYIADKGIFENSHWFDISVGDSEVLISDTLSMGEYYQNGKVRFYKVTPSVSGIMRFRSDATVDVKVALTSDCTGEDLLAADDDSGNGTNFTMDYVYAEKGETYYLAVVNKSGTAGFIDLYGQIITDDYPNSCSIADSEGTPVPFINTFFESGYSNQTIPSGGVADPGIIGYNADEDYFVLEFDNGGTPVPGTVVISSALDGNGDAFGQTSPEYLNVVLKDSNCVTVAENSGFESILVIYPNPTGQACYLNIDRALHDDTGVNLEYAFEVRYYPIDETDPIEIVISGGVGSQAGAITVPGDQDRYFFDISGSGLITASTTGCALGEESRLDIYNSLNEKIVDNGATVAGTGNFEVTEAVAGETTVPFFVTPGRYYLRVSALYGHTTPFEYGVEVTFTSVSDDHSDYQELSSRLIPWEEASATSPRLYFYPQTGHMDGASDVDYFRMDIPYDSSVMIMADFADSPNNSVRARLFNYKGNLLAEKADIRMANPDYPTADPSNIPTWASGTQYLANAVVQYNSSYYRCVSDTSGIIVPTLSPAWDAVATPPSGASGLETGLEPATYYIEISGVDNLDYRISVDVDDFGNNWANAEEVKKNNAFRSIQGHLETASNPAFAYSNDADAFELHIQYPNQFRIFTTGTSNTYGIIKCINVPSCSEGDVYPGWAAYADEDYDEYGNFVIGNLDEEAPYTDFGIPLEAGTYSVELALSVPDASSPTTGDYVIHFQPRDDYCNKNACTEQPFVGALVGNSGTQSGVIETAGDIDYFAFSPTQTGRLTLSRGSGSLSVILCLMDSDDRRLTYSSSGTLEFDVYAGTNYYVLTKPEYALNTGPYELTFDVASGASTDDDGDGGSPGDDFSQASSLTFSGNTASYPTGGVDLPGDYDYYTFQVTGPGILNVYTTGDTDTYGYLFLERGNMFNLVMANDDSEYDTSDENNFGIYYYVAETGLQNFYVKVRGYSSWETGDYQLFVEFTSGEDDHGDECETATMVNRESDGATWAGDHIVFQESRIGISGDTDYFKCVAGPEGSDKGTITVSTSDGTVPVDTFGYLKNLNCGTLAMNDNGGGGSSGSNFRISYSPGDCVIGADADCTPGEDCECIPQVYHVLVRDYSGTETGTYDFHSSSNGMFVESVSTSRMTMSANGIRYVAFDAPNHDSDFSAAVTGVSGFPAGSLRMTLVFGDGTVVKDAGDTNVENRAFPVLVPGLERGLHFIRIENTGGSSGDFDLDLTCE